jgi:hypothetical protein
MDVGGEGQSGGRVGWPDGEVERIGKEWRRAERGIREIAGTRMASRE